MLPQFLVLAMILTFCNRLLGLVFYKITYLSNFNEIKSNINRQVNQIVVFASYANWHCKQNQPTV